MKKPQLLEPARGSRSQDQHFVYLVYTCKISPKQLKKVVQVTRLNTYLVGRRSGSDITHGTAALLCAGISD